MKLTYLVKLTIVVLETKKLHTKIQKVEAEREQMSTVIYFVGSEGLLECI